MTLTSLITAYCKHVYVTSPLHLYHEYLNLVYHTIHLLCNHHASMLFHVMYLEYIQLFNQGTCVSKFVAHTNLLHLSLSNVTERFRMAPAPTLSFRRLLSQVLHSIFHDYCFNIPFSLLAYTPPTLGRVCIAIVKQHVRCSTMVVQTTRAN